MIKMEEDDPHKLIEISRQVSDIAITSTKKEHHDTKEKKDWRSSNRWVKGSNMAKKS